MIPLYFRLRKSLFFSFVFLSHSAFSQTYNFENFSVEDGLAQNQILCIFQDDRGYIWFGTNGGGTSIYNGTGFQTLSQADGLVGNVVYSIIQDKNGNMVFCTNGGFSIYSRSGFTNFTIENGLPHNWVFCVKQNVHGDLIFGTNQGVVKYSGGKIIPFSEDRDSLLKNVGVWSMYEDSRGNLWFGTLKKGIVRYSPAQNKFTHISVANGLDYPAVWTMVEDREGNMWAGTLKGLNKIDRNDLVTPLRMKDNETTITVTSSCLSKDGNLWFGTLSGLDKYSGNTGKRYNENNGLITSSIRAILEDREGNLWMGTDGKGVSKLRYKGEVFMNFSEKNNLPNDDIRAIYKDSHGNFWFGSSGGITRMKEDGQVETFSKLRDKVKIGLATNTYSITEDLEGNIWFATRSLDVGCNVYNGKDFITYSEKDGLSDDMVNFVMRDRHGSLWFGTNNGVCKKTGNSFSVIPGMEGKIVWWILQDNESHFWFATDNGAIEYDGSSLQYFSKKDGFVDGRVRTIVQDVHKTYWFATDEGIFNYNSGNFHQVNQAEGLISNTAYSLLLDGKNSLWVGTNKGLSRLNIDHYFTDKEIIIKNYGKEDGFIGVECNGNAAYKDQKGNLWFGTVKGVTVFNPEMETVNTSEPITHITNLRLDFENFNWTEFSDSTDASGLPVNLVLPYNKNHLTFDFVGVSLTIPKKVKYQYKLEPIETSFTPPTSQNEAVYPHLPPGDYTFVLKAKNNDDYWNSKPIEFHFSILPPWYQTWWFYTLFILAFITGVWSFIVIREKNLRRQKLVLELQVRERTAELREEKEKVEQINLEVIEKNKIIELKNKDITDSINYAERIQAALLPSEGRMREKIPDFFVLYQPKDIVSGDFYWFGNLGNKTIIAAADCTGHGVPGAFMSMIGHNLLNQIILRSGISNPGEILKQLNNNLKIAFRQSDRTKTNDGMDIALCCITDNKILEFAGAQRPLWLVRNGELIDTRGNPTPIGGITEENFEYTTHRFEIFKNDSFYSSSDGYQDQFGGPKGKKFMTKRLKETLVQMQHLPMKDQCLQLEKNQRDWMKGSVSNNFQAYEQVDDVLVIGVRF